jgi:hypothetical protein
MYKIQNTNQAYKDTIVCIRAGFGKKLAAIIKTILTLQIKVSSALKTI